MSGFSARKRIAASMVTLLLTVFAFSPSAQQGAWTLIGGVLSYTANISTTAVSIWNKSASGCSLVLKSGSTGTTVFQVCGSTITPTGSIALASGQCVSWNADTYLGRVSAGVVGVGTSCGGVQGTISAAKHLAGDGTAAAPSVAFASAPSMGMYLYASSVLGFATSGALQARLGTNATLELVSNAATLRFGASSDVILARDAPNTFAQRNGTNAQAFNIYNTYTSSSSYERLQLYWTGNIGTISVGKGGSGGAARDIAIGTDSTGILRFNTNGSTRWYVDSSGHLLANSDNTYDIGASGATRPRNIYVAGNGVYGAAVQAGTWLQATNGVEFIASKSIITSPSDGVLRLTNNAQTDFSRLQFGGTTSSFPAIARSGVNLAIRLADDSGYTNVLAGTFITQNEVAVQFGGTTSSFPALKRSGTGLVARLADDSGNTDFTAGTLIAAAFTFNGTTGKTGTTCTQFDVGGCTAATEPLDAYNLLWRPLVQEQLQPYLDRIAWLESQVNELKSMMYREAK